MLIDSISILSSTHHKFGVHVGMLGLKDLKVKYQELCTLRQ